MIDSNKVTEGLYPPEFMDVFKVLDFGATKYGPNSWLKGEHFDHKSNYASICRHFAEVLSGKTRDEESGLHPALHAACRLLMVHTLHKRSKDKPIDQKATEYPQEFLDMIHSYKEYEEQVLAILNLDESEDCTRISFEAASYHAANMYMHYKSNRFVSSSAVEAALSIMLPYVRWKRENRDSCHY